MRFVPLSLSLAVALVSCRQTTAPPIAVSVSLVANTAVVPRGDTVTFTVNAAGNNLVGVVIDYGDEAVDQYATGGALSARVTFKHVYSVAGNYTVRATVTDAISGEHEATVSVVVN
jgi:PKD repeat protein